MEEILWHTERKYFARARQPLRREKERERERERKTERKNCKEKERQRVKKTLLELIILTLPEDC